MLPSREKDSGKGECHGRLAFLRISQFSGSVTGQIRPWFDYSDKGLSRGPFQDMMADPSCTYIEYANRPR